jgi:hypothetical protein
VAIALREHGVPTFFSPANLLGAQQWQDEILKALQRCDWFLVVLSPGAIESMWVRRETGFALSDPRYDNRIIALNYQPCDLKTLEWLRLFQMIDFQHDFDNTLRELLKVWGIGLKA